MTTQRNERIARPVGAGEHGPIYSGQLTPREITDPLILHYEDLHVLPVIFVPGIMGSNLCRKGGAEPVWRLDVSALIDQPVSLATDKAFDSPGKRQKDLHPDRTEVDGRGALSGPTHSHAQSRGRGWGEVGQGSYHAWLLALDEVLNGHRAGSADGPRVGQHYADLMRARPPGGERDAPWRPVKDFVAPTPEQIRRMDDWYMPVYACGYNWLQDNRISAKRLAERIKNVISSHHNGKTSFCKQVVLVTHSMGGLVARACAMLPGMEPLIAGVVHGVMPTNGAAVAYRRCKVGMWDEADVGTAMTIGATGRHVTPVFAQSPGALELLPTHNYNLGWLEIQGPDGKTVAQALPERDPYEEIYKRRDRWWGLVKEEWLAPEGGVPIRWSDYVEKYLQKAEEFHQSLPPNSYHPNTYAFYGADNQGKTRSFERVVWSMQQGPMPSDGSPPPSPGEVFGLTPQQVRLDGRNPEHVGGRERDRPVTRGADGRMRPIGATTVDSSHWKLRVAMQDGSGDGTVPASSGRAPADCAAVKQVFRLTGVEHEPAYRHATAQQVTVYSLIKIAQQAVWPAPVATAAAGKT